MSQQKYDIFISYRRDSFNQANLICTRLKALGYRVFIDVEALNSGKFNEQLLTVIKNCTDFIVVLPPNALDRCENRDDWVRREVMCAIENKKNIIPIMLAGFEWPATMPEGMEELCMYQSLAPMPDVYFDMQIKKLQGYLKSKAHYKKRRRWLIGLSIVAALIALLLIVTRITFMPVAQHLADSLLLRTEEMREADEINTDAFSEWEAYLNNRKKAKSADDIENNKKVFLKNITSLEKEANTLLKTMETNKITVSGWYIPLFWLKGIPAIDLMMMDTYTTSCFDDLQCTFDYYKQVIEEDNYSLPIVNMAKVNCNINHASVEMYYYSYLQILTHLPKSTHERFYHISPEWTNLPKTGLGLPDKEYERLINATAEAMSEQINIQKKITEQFDAELDSMQDKLDALEQQGEEMDRILDSIGKLSNSK